MTETHPSPSSAALKLRSPTAARQATFTVPASWKAPTRVTVITATATRTFAVHAVGSKLTLAAGAGKLTLVRHGHAVTIGGLPAQTTGVTVRFPVAGSAEGPVAVRVVPIHGGAKTVHIDADGRSAT